MAELSPTESQLIGSRIREARVKRRMSELSWLIKPESPFHKSAQSKTEGVA